MQYAVCVVPVAPIRVAPGHKDEMVSQLLFGEGCVITETDKSGFVKIIVQADGYTGWCLATQLTGIDEVLYQKTTNVLTGEWSNALDFNSSKMIVPFGSTLRGLQEGTMHLGKNTFNFNGNVLNPGTVNSAAETVQQIATMFLNTPYLWGGRSVFGIDCSGFTQMVFKCINIALLRDAKQQAGQGELVNFLQEAKCGDLAFFDNAAGEIIHVGLLLNDHEIIHASGKVQVDKIDNGGIINAGTGLRTQQLRIIKRYF